MDTDVRPRVLPQLEAYLDQYLLAHVLPET